MSTVAAIRPSEWEFPLFLHVLGAVILMGTVFVSAVVLLAAWRKRDPREVASLTRFGLWTIILGVVPSYVLMRIGAEWIYSREGFGDDGDPDWIGIGYTVADIGFLLILVSIVLAIVGIRRLKGADREKVWVGRVTGVIAVFLLVMYSVAVWAMTGKPGCLSGLDSARIYRICRGLRRSSSTTSRQRPFWRPSRSCTPTMRKPLAGGPRCSLGSPGRRPLARSRCRRGPRRARAARAAAARCRARAPHDGRRRCPRRPLGTRSGGTPARAPPSRRPPRRRGPRSGGRGGAPRPTPPRPERRPRTSRPHPRSPAERSPRPRPSPQRHRVEAQRGNQRLIGGAGLRPAEPPRVTRVCLRRRGRGNMVHGPNMVSPVTTRRGSGRAPTASAGPGTRPIPSV